MQKLFLFFFILKQVLYIVMSVVFDNLPKKTTNFHFNLQVIIFKKLKLFTKITRTKY
jgi:hypothetical protein